MRKERIALKKFYESVGEHYPEEEEVYKTLRGRLRRQFILSRLAQFNGSLLDVGCNRGMYLSAYAGGPKFGVDISRSVLHHAPEDNSLKLAVADAGRLCFQENSFDHVLCSEVLEHCLDPLAVFTAIAHVLKPGGIALTTTPNYSGKKPRWIGLGVLQAYGVKSDCHATYYHTAYRPEELEQMAHQSGLTVLESGTLEKDVKYAAKLPATILLLGRLVNRAIRSNRFNRLNENLFQDSSNLIYAFCRATRLDRLLIKFVNEGVRSYIIVRKEATNT
jgi:2-polyprenyl-6-hydroxyphenyl methylase/3-demethylubiquinone-9 3-methyltransferase